MCKTPLEAAATSSTDMEGVSRDEELSAVLFLRALSVGDWWGCSCPSNFDKLEPICVDVPLRSLMLDKS